MLLFTRPQTTWDKNQLKCIYVNWAWVCVCVLLFVYFYSNKSIHSMELNERSDCVPVSTLRISNHFVPSLLTRKRNADHVTIHFFVVFFCFSSWMFLSSCELSSNSFMIGVSLLFAYVSCVPVSVSFVLMSEYIYIVVLMYSLRLKCDEKCLIHPNIFRVYCCCCFWSHGFVYLIWPFQGEKMNGFLLSDYTEVLNDDRMAQTHMRYSSCSCTSHEQWPANRHV